MEISWLATELNGAFIFQDSPPSNNNERFSTGVESVVVQLVQRVSWLEQNQVSMAEQLQRCTE